MVKVRFLFVVSLVAASVMLFSIKMYCFPVGNHPLRLNVSDGYITVSDSLHGRVAIFHKNKFVSEIKGLNFPVWALVYNGYVYITDVDEGKIFRYTISGEYVNSYDIFRPEMIKVYNGKVYVSAGKTIYEFTPQLDFLRKWTFPCGSVYFYFKDNTLVYLNYWQWKNVEDVYYVDLKSGNVIKKMNLGLKRPFRYVQFRDFEIFLDYSLGDVVVLKNGKVFWRVDLPALSYGLAVYNSNIYVTNLSRNVLYIIELESKSLKKVKTPYPLGDIVFYENVLVGGGVFDDKVAIFDADGNFLKEFSCNYPVMITKTENGVAVLCSDSGKICFIDLR